MRKSLLSIVAGLLGAGGIVLLAVQPGYATDDRPFGGPLPPSTRKLELAKGTSCKTATISCKLQSAQRIGTVCACAGSDGKAVDGKVVADGTN
jgi:hypothetical protein